MRRTVDQRRHDVGERSNALWGDGRKKLMTILSTLVVAVTVIAGTAVPASATERLAYVTPSLLVEASSNPDRLFNVIVQAAPGKNTADVAGEVTKVQKDVPGDGSSLKRRFLSIEGTSATLTGKQILELAKRSGIDSVTADSKVELTAYTNGQQWPAAAGIEGNWASTLPASSYPTIAVVDSGITNLMLGSRLVKSVSMVTASTNNGAYGHGSMVASIAAGENTGYAGAEPRAKIVSVKVLDGNGIGLKSDIVAAVDWILLNKSTYNIRVANFSVNAGGDGFRFDALDKAVEKLWFNGVTVVVAAGNYAVGGIQSDVGYAPANDPFVITVGASDINGTAARNDDFPAPWSAWGRTQDGFFKPEIAAPGRVMIGSTPSGANLLTQFPTRITAPGYYMWMSGTSFAAPVVSGIASAIIAANPTWTPDQVKGAIMQTATVPAGYNSTGALGVGAVNGSAAVAAPGTANPNAGLNQFVTTAGGVASFDASRWYEAAQSNASWSSASWSSASWSSASWSSASWSSASWSSASWSSASWASASWANASWANTSSVE